MKTTSTQPRLVFYHRLAVSRNSTGQHVVCSSARLVGRHRSRESLSSLLSSVELGHVDRILSTTPLSCHVPDRSWNATPSKIHPLNLVPPQLNTKLQQLYT